MSENRQQEVRKILGDIARAVDRRLVIEVRELPQERVHVALTHGNRRGQIELGVPTVLGAAGDAVARNELRLRVKRATDTMLFRAVPDHRLNVKPVAPPGGQTLSRGAPRGRGRR
jgi:hypothetical protein